MYLLIFSRCSFHNCFSPSKIIREKQYPTSSESAHLCVCCISAEVVRASTCKRHLAYKRFPFPDCLKLSVFKLCCKMMRNVSSVVSFCAQSFNKTMNSSWWCTKQPVHTTALDFTIMPSDRFCLEE